MIVVSAATHADVPDLNKLVNSGYRGEESKKGWTSEADLLSGIRTHEDGIHSMLDNPYSTILKAVDEEKGLIACVYLEKQGNQLYLGMLTVSPTLQGGGIGKLLLHEAEKYGKTINTASIIMTVISVRTELIEWYKRKGYVLNGKTKPFPINDPKFGLPNQPLEFVELEKRLDIS